MRMHQWRSSAPKSEGTTFFFQKSEKQKKKNKKKQKNNKKKQTNKQRKRGGGGGVTAALNRKIGYCGWGPYSRHVIVYSNALYLLHIIWMANELYIHRYFCEFSNDDCDVNDFRAICVSTGVFNVHNLDTRK